LSLIGLASFRTWCSESKPPPAIQIVPEAADPVIVVLDQEAAFPGKIIHIKQPGLSEFRYRCRPDDAAYSVFTFRDKHSGTDLGPEVKSAVDSSGNEYMVSTIGYSHVNILTLKRGFARRPSGVSVKVSVGNTGKACLMNLTKISDPVRELASPTADAASKAECFAKATYSDRNGLIFVTPIGPTKPSMSTFVRILASTYSSWSPYEHRSAIPFNTFYGKSVEAIQTRLDRIRSEQSESTLVYRNAKVVDVNGKHFLYLPTQQNIGTVIGQTAVLSNHLPIQKQGYIPKSTLANEELEVRWFSKSNDGLSRPRLEYRDTPYPTIQIESVSPNLEEMGLDSLKVIVSGSNRTFGPMHGVTKAFRSAIHPSAPTLREIPELKIRLRVTVYSLVSSQTVVLPVHHIDVGAKGQPFSSPFQYDTDRMRRH